MHGDLPVRRPELPILGQLFLRHLVRRRRGCFERLAGAWVKSQNLQAFLKACEVFIAEHSAEGTPEDKATEWQRWARRYADRLDPLENGDFEKMLRQVDEPFKSIY